MSLVYHEFLPVYREDSAVLILGSIPSPKSREQGFYYGHPQNRFWKVLSYLFEEEIPESKQEKINFLFRHHIALWDVLAECEIDGASDNSIRNEKPNDMNIILNVAPIQKIFTTGKKAQALYQKHCYSITRVESICLPSTSPANCAYKLEQLIQAYRELLIYCK